MQQVSAFFWYENLQKFENKFENSDSAPLKWKLEFQSSFIPCLTIYYVKQQSSIWGILFHGEGEMNDWLQKDFGLLQFNF